MAPPNTVVFVWGIREFTRETQVDAIVILFRHFLIEMWFRKGDGRREPTKNTPPKKDNSSSKKNH